jgi:hypothetical protein
VDKKLEGSSWSRWVGIGFDKFNVEAENILLVNDGISSGVSGALRTRLRRLPDHHLNSPEWILAFTCPSGVGGRD